MPFFPAILNPYNHRLTPVEVFSKNSPSPSDRRHWPFALRMSNTVSLGIILSNRVYFVDQFEINYKYPPQIHPFDNGFLWTTLDGNGTNRQEKTRKPFQVAGLKDFAGSLCIKTWCEGRRRIDFILTYISIYWKNNVSSTKYNTHTRTHIVLRLQTFFDHRNKVRIHVFQKFFRSNPDFYKFLKFIYKRPPLFISQDFVIENTTNSF